MKMHTNSTTNFGLPQWIGSDKPTFLGDLNSAFLEIDTIMHQAQTLANNAGSVSQNAINQVTNLSSQTGDNTNDITALKASVLTLTNSVNALTSTINNFTDITLDNQSLITGVGNYLSSFSPTLTGYVMYRILKIGSFKFLNLFGTVTINYSGTPSITEISNISTLQLNAELKELVEITGSSRSFTNIGNYSFQDSTSQWHNFPISYFSSNNNLRPINGINSYTIKENSRVILTFQAFYLLSAD